MMALVLIGLTLIAYLPCLRGEFLWDDDEAIANNPMLHTPGGISRIWAEPENSPQGHYWPLVYTSFWIEGRLWGIQPFAMHLVNVLLHATNSLLLWLLL